MGVGKCTGRISVSVSATAAKKRRREQRRLLRVPVDARRPIGLPALNRMMHEIAGHHRTLALGKDVDAAMAGRMARRRRQRDGVIECIIVVDQQRLSRLDDGQAIVAKYRARRIVAFRVFRLPCRVFAFVEDIFRVRKRRHPATVAQNRVPAGVVDVQMRAEHIVDLVEPMPSANSSLRQRSLPGKSNGGGWPLSSPVQVSTRMV